MAEVVVVEKAAVAADVKAVAAAAVAEFSSVCFVADSSASKTNKTL